MAPSSINNKTTDESDTESDEPQKNVRPWHGHAKAPKIFRAVWSHDWDGARALLQLKKQRDRANFVDEYGYTSLHFACWKDAPLDVIRNLVFAFPDAARHQNIKGRTPLHFSCWRGTDQIVSILVRQCPKAASILDHNWKSPLTDACVRFRSESVLTDLLEADASQVNVPDRWGRSPALTYFRISHGQMIAMANLGLEFEPACLDIMRRARLLLNAELRGTVVPSLSVEHRNWSNIQSAVAVKSCPFTVVDVAIKYHPDEIRSAGVSGDYLLHAAAKGKPFLYADFYKCDFCELKHTKRSEYPMYFNKDPNRSHWGVSCQNCMKPNSLSNYVPVYPVDKDSSVIHLLVGVFPEAAAFPDQNGRLPLHLAVDAGKEWDSGGVKRLLLTEPRALATRDQESCMYPFIMAARKHDSELSGEESTSRVACGSVCNEQHSAQHNANSSFADALSHINVSQGETATVPELELAKAVSWSDDTFPSDLGSCHLQQLSTVLELLLADPTLLQKVNYED